MGTRFCLGVDRSALTLGAKDEDENGPSWNFSILSCANFVAFTYHRRHTESPALWVGGRDFSLWSRRNKMMTSLSRDRIVPAPFHAVSLRDWSDGVARRSGAPILWWSVLHPSACIYDSRWDGHWRGFINKSVPFLLFSKFVFFFITANK